MPAITESTKEIIFFCYLTTTLHTIFFLPTLIVIFAVPFLTAVIFPFELILAIFLLDVLYFIFCVQVIGSITGFSWYVFLRLIVSFFGTFLIFAGLTAFFWMVILIVFVSPLANLIVSVAFPVCLPALILHVPFLFPVIVTSFLLLLVQDFTESPLASPVTINLFVDCFFCIVNDDAFILIVGFSFVPIVLVSS